MNDFMPVTGDSTYCNPVPFSDGKIHTNPDPFVLRWCGRYYCYSSDEHGAKVSVSEDLCTGNTGVMQSVNKDTIITGRLPSSI